MKPAGLSQAAAELLDLVAPRSCIGCTILGTRWCASCALWLDQASSQHRQLGAITCHSAASYTEPLRTALSRWKDQSRVDFTAVLVASLRPLLVEGTSGILVPVPSSPKTQRVRGWQPVSRLARKLARAAPGWRAVPALRQTRRVAEQSGLNLTDRAQNLSGAMELHPGWASLVVGHPVVVLDDIITSGATLAESIRALTSGGAKVDYALTVAATGLNSGRRIT